MAFSDEQRPEAQLGNQNRSSLNIKQPGENYWQDFSTTRRTLLITARRSAWAMYCQQWVKVSPSPSGEQGKWPVDSVMHL